MTITRTFLFAAVMTALFFGSIFAQTPPAELEGSYSPMDTAVELRWHAPDVLPAPDHYNVYRKPEGSPDFQLLSPAPDRRYDDRDLVGGMAYTYRVTAVYPGPVESAPTNSVTVTVTAAGDSTGDTTTPSIHFQSSPLLSVQVGEPYLYQALVVTDPPGADVCFELHHAPAGMSVDTSGAISWTPSFLGVFEVEVRARLCAGGEDGVAEQEFRLMVTSGAAARLHGTVTDSLGQPVDSVRIKIFDATAGVFLLKTRTDSAGRYEFPVVNPGTYFLRADVEGDAFEDTWYDQARELANATPVVVPENGDVTADFVLGAAAQPDDAMFTVSGTVRDTAGGPVPGASVSLLRLFHHDRHDDDLFDDDREHGDDHAGEEAERSSTADSSGHYQITARAGEYVVRARARGFFPLFWDGQRSPLEAMVLPLHSDTGNIDFALTPRPAGMEGNGSISGTVRLADGATPFRAEVIGFMKNSTGRFTGLVTSAHADSSGGYTLDELPAGYYLVMAKGENGIIPTFYSTGGGTARLDSAGLVMVQGGPVTGIDITAELDTADGLNDISGEVEIENETPGKNSLRRPSATSPLAGAIVTIIGSGGHPAGYGITGQDGRYSVPGLAAGAYTAIFQKPGAGTSAMETSVAYQAGMPGTTILDATLPSEGGTGPVSLMGLSAGWNLVSVPAAAPDLSVPALFPTASTPAYGYDGAYRAEPTLQNGMGYWLKFAATQVVNIPGPDITPGSIPLRKGWNIIGSLSEPIPFESLVTEPAGLITSGAFGYEGGYHAATTIQPGRGYWIRASDEGTLTFQVSGKGAPGTSVPAAAAVPGLTLSFVDGMGNSQDVSLVPAADAAGISRSELPPVPPAGAFDVRFTSGRSVEQAEDGPATYRIALQSAGGDVTVSISGTLEGSAAVLSGPDGGEVLSTRNAAATARIAGVTELTLDVFPEAAPREYRLSRNYPNPFNPSTTVAFELPTESRVSLKVYNTLGQLVGSVVDGIEPAGFHAAVWDAGHAASGVYFFRFQADPVDGAGTGLHRNMKVMLVR